MSLKGLLVMLCLLLCVSAWAQSDYEPFFEESDCPFLVYGDEVEGETLVCGILFVPESRAGLSENEVELQVAILFSTNPDPGIPTIYLEGGPGGSAVMSVMDVWAKSALRQVGDLIIVDQRGAGYSYPSLDCTQFEDLVGEEDDPEQICYDELTAQGIVLEAYNSRENAADIADLATALEYEQVNLYGISYGTRLALTIMRDHPELLRAVIIDGVFPPHIQGYEEQPINGERAFEVLFEDCAANADCTDAFGDLRQLLYDTVEQLDNEPLAGDEEDIFGETLVNAIFQDMYDTNMIPYLPAKIYAASVGDVDSYYELIPEFTGEEAPAEAEEYYSDDDSEGMFQAIECYEEVHFNDFAAVEAASADIAPALYTALVLGVDSQFAACNVWQTGQSSTLENEPVISDIPTLVLSGQYDPITPPAWGDAAAEYLSNSFVYTFPAMGHGTVDVRPCPTDIALQFLADPTQEPDASCITNMPPPDFVIP
jgi:pimeloyl-ACP methyl ester carboxylesterase